MGIWSYRNEEVKKATVTGGLELFPVVATRVPSHQDKGLCCLETAFVPQLLLSVAMQV